MSLAAKWPSPVDGISDFGEVSCVEHGERPPVCPVVAGKIRQLYCDRRPPPV